MARITKIQNEKRSSFYHQAKSRNSIQGVNSDFLEILRTPEDITADAVPEPFIHLSQQTENMVPCYLKSELSKIDQKDLYFDGTFSLVRNLDYNQIYIVSIVYSNGGTAVFSYPVMFFLMKKKLKIDYIEILTFIKNLYFEEFGTKLKDKYFHSDAKLSFMQAIPEVFPESNTILCSVHIYIA